MQDESEEKTVIEYKVIEYKVIEYRVSERKQYGREKGICNP